MSNLRGRQKIKWHGRYWKAIDLVEYIIKKNKKPMTRTEIQDKTELARRTITAATQKLTKENKVVSCPNLGEDMRTRLFKAVE